MNSWVNTGITPQVLERALARVEASFLDSTGAEALVARREAGRAEPGDDAALARRIDELLAAQRDDGSWRGALVATAETLLELSELCGDERPVAVCEAAARGVAWLRTLRGRPGRFGDGCTPADHRLGLCHHFLGGFFAPEPPIPPEGGLVLCTGARFPAGPAARLAVSCLALQATLRWGAFGPDAWLHLDGLRRLLELDARSAAGPVPVDALPAVAFALLEAPHSPEFTPAAERAVARITQTQRADGSWPELDAFSILEVLLAAARAGLRSPALDAAIHRGACLLAVTQHEDGRWERDGSARRILIGWRTLRHAVRHGRGEHPAPKGDD